MVDSSIRTHNSPDGFLTFIGGRSRGGTYLLRIRVRKRLSLAFGQFEGGRTIVVERGEYAYVGSALAEFGAACLARRLTRHATRLGDRPPHPIRDLMLTAFRRLGLCGEDPCPLGPKKPKWNVDHLLDRIETNLVGVYLLRGPMRLEERLGQLVATDPAAVTFAPGLGANDIPGNTHLLRIDAEEAWWQGLPDRLQRFRLIEEVRKVLGDATAENMPTSERLSNRDLARLLRMWPERCAEVLRRMAAGATFTRAERESQSVYDTLGWYEILSRLRRGRGAVQKLAKILKHQRNALLKDIEQRRCLARRAAQLNAGVAALKNLVRGLRSAPTMDRPLPRGRRPSRDNDSRTPLHITFRQAEGMLKLCDKFLTKNVRDVPLMRRKTLVPGPTPQERAVIAAELAQIVEATGDVLRACGIPPPGRAGSGTPGSASRRECGNREERTWR